MAIYTNLPIYRSSYSLLLEVSRIMPNMPREGRYTIGQDLRHKLMDIIIAVYRANRTRSKVHIIRQMRESLLEVQVYIRLLCDMKHISEKQYLMLAEHTAGISRQMTAWEKSEIKKQERGPESI